jgi:hypothetical protein
MKNHEKYYKQPKPQKRCYLNDEGIKSTMKGIGFLWDGMERKANMGELVGFFKGRRSFRMFNWTKLWVNCDVCLTDGLHLYIPHKN